MKANQAAHQIRTMCRVLGVSASGYYDWIARGPSERAKVDAVLTTAIGAYHAHSRETYGAPRILRDLIDADIHVGQKRVARLMRAAGIRGISRRKWTSTTRRDPAAKAAPDLVQRNFTATGPDKLWVADITYVPTSAGFLYLAVVLDAFSRRIVGWAMANHLRTELVLDALDMAVAGRQPKDVNHHSDKGTQYTAIAFGARCRQAGVRPSTGTAGDCFDNGMCESFFATLECELIARETFPSQPAARRAIFEFIEGWYNPHRRHSGLNYVSPIDFERGYLNAQLAA
jgi:putative transposase